MMAYFGVDWGSSSFRAYKFDEDGTVGRTIEDSKGILRVENGEFESVLFTLLGSHLQAGDTLLFSGMITSRNGWIETPYVQLPATIQSYLANALQRRVQNVDMIFLPGVCQQSPADVIRGEELQIFGVCGSDDDAVIILPGTHSKLVEVNQGMISAFRTTMTGEVYDLLLTHSLVGLIADGKEYLEESFLKGVRAGAQSGALLNKTFTARAGVLLGQFGAEEVASYLSGLLIGHEIGDALAVIDDRDMLLLIIGGSVLCDRYTTALNCLGWENHEVVANAAINGYSRLIQTLVG